MWQQRLQTMERELQHNKQHIHQLMQQLHAIAAKQAASPEPGLDTVVTSAMLRHPPGLQSSPTVVIQSSSSSPSHSSSSTQGEVVFGGMLQPHQDHNAASILQQPSPLGDATNRVVNSSHRHQQNGSSNIFASSSSSKPKAAGSWVPSDGDENSFPSKQQQQPQQDCIASKPAACSSNSSSAEQPQRGAEIRELRTVHQQQQDDGHLADAQRQLDALQQRAKQLEAENAQLKSAHAEAAAQIDSLRLRQQAEELKQVRNCPQCPAGVQMHLGQAATRSADCMMLKHATTSTWISDTNVFGFASGNALRLFTASQTCSCG